jgi:excisionase family DNA binding protein
MTEQPDNPTVQVDGTHPALAGQVDGVLVNLDGSLTVQEAAAQLGISERTIRRRIKDGSLTAYKLPTTQGYEWRVHLDSSAGQVDGVTTRHGGKLDSTPVQSAGTIPDQVTTPAIVAALELAEQLRRDNVALASRNEQLAGQVGFLQAKMQDQDRQIALLMAPKDDEPTQPDQRPWWRRLLG